MRILVHAKEIPQELAKSILAVKYNLCLAFFRKKKNLFVVFHVTLADIKIQNICKSKTGI